MPRQINCTMTGLRTDVPTLQIDTVPHVYLADVTEPGRAIFRVSDGDPPWGATITFGRQTVRLVIPLGSGATEGPWLNYPPAPVPLERLHVEGTAFITASGQPWIWKGCSDFLLYKRFLEGEDLTRLLEERRELGANLLRVFGMLHFIERFSPKAYRGSYYESLPLFADLLALSGFYLEFVTFADQQQIGVVEQTHFVECCDQLATRPNTFIELCNEYPKNGIDPRHFSKPAEILASAGSALADAAPDVFWDFFGWHGRRDWPKVTSSCEDMYAVIQQRQIPGVHDEPARQDRPAEFSPHLAAQIALTSRLLGSGATFHSISGLRSQPFTPFELECAHAFFVELT